MTKDLQEFLDDPGLQQALGFQRMTLLVALIKGALLKAELAGEVKAVDTLQAALNSAGNRILKRLRDNQSTLPRSGDRPWICSVEGQRQIELVRDGKKPECYVKAKVMPYGSNERVLRVSHLGDGDVTWEYLPRDETPAETPV